MCIDVSTNWHIDRMGQQNHLQEWQRSVWHLHQYNRITQGGHHGSGCWTEQEWLHVQVGQVGVSSLALHGQLLTAVHL